MNLISLFASASVFLCDAYALLVHPVVRSRKVVGNGVGISHETNRHAHMRV